MGKKERELSLVIPTYNEKDSIKDVMERIFSNLKRYRVEAEVLVVDDSKDGTDRILAGLARSNKNLKVIHRENKRGVGSAIRLGLEKASGKYAVVFMSDAPDDIKYIPPILEKLRQGYALVQTSRFMKGSEIIGYPFIKTVANRIANLFVRIAFLRFDLKDFTSLFKGVNRKLVGRLGLEADQFDVGLEISMKSIRKGYRITEVPVSWKEREVGKSKLSLRKQAPHFIKRVLKVWLFYW
jgi:dolichol-phosphate mannosyltransferase